jgi:NAD(P)H dehydrogenase (quinone)
MNPTILVTGATGKTGLPTVKELLARGFPVRALVHREDGRSQALRDLGAEVVPGSLEDLGALSAAMAGVHRAYFCPPLLPGTLRRATLFAAAAAEARLEVVVVLSQWLSDPDHPALHAREKWLASCTFAWAPFDVVTLAPGWFADNYMAALEPISQLGVFAMPLGEGCNAPPSNEDIGRVAAGLLADPAGHLGKTYRPTGPTLLSPPEIAETFARVLGRPVRYQNAPLGLFLKVARTLGVGDYVISQLHWFLLDYQRGSFAVGAPTDVVREVAGTAPDPFEAIVRRYVQGSPFARRTLGAGTRALSGILRSMLTRGPDLERIASRLELPRLPGATLAADSPRWKAAH